MGVVHCKKEKFDVYIGRPSKWGNPFEIGKDGNRQQVIEKFEIHLRNSPELMAEIMELDGKVLACWCSPRPCHGDAILKIINELRKSMQPNQGTEVE